MVLGHIFSTSMAVMVLIIIRNDLTVLSESAGVCCLDSFSLDYYTFGTVEICSRHRRFELI